MLLFLDCRKIRVRFLPLPEILGGKLVSCLCLRCSRSLLPTASAGFITIFKSDLEETEAFLVASLASHDDAVRQLELEEELEAAERNTDPMKLSTAAFKGMLRFIESRFPNCELNKDYTDRLRSIYMGKNSSYSQWVTDYKGKLQKAVQVAAA